MPPSPRRGFNIGAIPYPFIATLALFLLASGLLIAAVSNPGHGASAVDAPGLGETSPAPETPVALTRYPYLGECTTSSITIAWRTDIPSTSTVKYGTTPALGLEQSDPTLVVQHALTLTGLSPNTTYYYQVLSNGQPLAEPTLFAP